MSEGMAYTVSRTWSDREGERQSAVMAVFLTLDEAKAAVEAHASSQPWGNRWYEWVTFPNPHFLEYGDAGGGTYGKYSIGPVSLGALR